MGFGHHPPEPCKVRGGFFLVEQVQLDRRPDSHSHLLPFTVRCVLEINLGPAAPAAGASLSPAALTCGLVDPLPDPSRHRPQADRSLARPNASETMGGGDLAGARAA